MMLQIYTLLKYLQTFLKLIHKIHFIHLAGFDLVGDVDVWFHWLVVVVSGTFDYVIIVDQILDQIFVISNNLH